MCLNFSEISPIRVIKTGAQWDGEIGGWGLIGGLGVEGGSVRP